MMKMIGWYGGWEMGEMIDDGRWWNGEMVDGGRWWNGEMVDGGRWLNEIVDDKILLPSHLSTTNLSSSHLI